MPTRSKTKAGAKRPSAREKTLSAECRRLRAELARVQVERDSYFKSLYHLSRKELMFTAAELRAMRKNPLGISDIIEELEKTPV